LSIIVIGVILIPVWVFIICPELLSSTEILEITAQNMGEIQFSEGVGEKLSEPITMVFDWNRKVIQSNGNEMTIQTKYEYRDIVTGEIFWITEFDENIDKISRKYLEKEGYFMWPNNVEKKDYNVYDIGGTILHYSFEGVEMIEDMQVYKFVGKTTFDISDVYEEFDVQIFEDYSAINYIDPITGLEISFSEEFTDYAIIDGQKIIVLDASDSTTSHSQTMLIKQAKQTQSLYYVYKIIIPFVFVIITIAIFIGTLQHTRLKNEHEELISTQKKLEDERKENLKLEKFKTIGQLAARISHDIRNPLQVIDISIESMFMRDQNKFDEQDKKSIKRIQRAISRTNHQIDDVLDFVKESKLILEKASILKCIKNSIHDIDFSDKVSVNLPEKDVEIIMDSNRMEVVFTNILLNANDKFENKSGKINITLDEDEKYLEIKIEDSGKEIPQSDIEKIFEPLFTTKQKGTGLGLASCATIVKQHLGTISMQNNPTTFIIRLPKKLIFKQTKQSVK